MCGGMLLVAVAALVALGVCAAALPEYEPQSLQLLPSQQRAIRIGVLIPYNVSLTLRELVGYDRSIGALAVAVASIRERGLLDAYDFAFDVQDDQCSEAQATGRAVNMIEEGKVDLLIGPTCSDRQFDWWRRAPLSLFSLQPPIASHRWPNSSKW